MPQRGSAGAEWAHTQHGQSRGSTRDMLRGNPPTPDPCQLPGIIIVCDGEQRESKHSSLTYWRGPCTPLQHEKQQERSLVVLFQSYRQREA